MTGSDADRPAEPPAQPAPSPSRPVPQDLRKADDRITRKSLIGSGNPEITDE